MMGLALALSTELSPKEALMTAALDPSRPRKPQAAVLHGGFA